MKRLTATGSAVLIAMFCLFGIAVDRKTASGNISDTAIQDNEALKKVKAEDLLKEVRARELRSELLDFSDLLLESHNIQQTHQAGLKRAKLNPQLSRYDFSTLVVALIDQQKIIYGKDNRKDVYLISTDNQLKKSVEAVVSLFDRNRVIPLGDGRSKIVKKTFGTEFRLCDSEPFYSQPCSAFCSGVLVAPDIIATAGHCIDTSSEHSPPLKDIRFVFGYRMRDASDVELVIKDTEIYSGKEIIGQVNSPNGADWALVRLDRRVKDHLPAPIRRTSKIADADDVYVIGHPCGLPAKFADGAIVRDNSKNDFFVANLDTYGGNSGSPVFNKKTHEVEGILVRGEKDFASQNLSASNSCRLSLACPDTGCRGEDCVRTTIFANLIPHN